LTFKYFFNFDSYCFKLHVKKSYKLAYTMYEGHTFFFVILYFLYSLFLLIQWGQNKTILSIYLDLISNCVNSFIKRRSIIFWQVHLNLTRQTRDFDKWSFCHIIHSFFLDLKSADFANLYYIKSLIVHFKERHTIGRSELINYLLLWYSVTLFRLSSLRHSVIINFRSLSWQKLYTSNSNLAYECFIR
jgi:hypothetical protein